MTNTTHAMLVDRLTLSLRQAVLLLLLVIALTGGIWLLRSERLPLRAELAFYELDLSVPMVTAPAAVALYEEGAHLFVDTRRVEIDNVTHIPGAFSVRQESFDEDLYASMDFLLPEDPVILYGDGNLQAIDAIAARLLDRGFIDLAIMNGGLASWRQAGGPLSANTDAEGNGSHD